MVQFNLPQNSKIEVGEYYKDKTNSKNLKKVNVYRWDPSTGKNPRVDTFEVDMDNCGPKVLDILFNSLKSLKWQTKCGALTILCLFKNLDKNVVQQNLPKIILKLIDTANDIKREVKAQTRQCFEDLCSVIDNVDIIKSDNNY